MVQKLILFQKIYDFALWLDPVVRGFSKAHRYTLGIHIQNETLELMQSVIRVNLKQMKREFIDECIVHYETVKVLVRLAHDMRGSGTLSMQQYEHAAKRLEEIGRLLGGWKNKFS